MTDLGLERGAVRLVDHHDNWRMLADNAIASIKRAAGDRIIAAKHVGSTAVPNLPAKPILDIALGVVGETCSPDLAQTLTALGYIDRGDQGMNGGHLFVWEPRPEVRSIHLHVVAHGGRQWRNYLVFRDALRADLHLHSAYSDLKRALAVQFIQDRAAYTSGKQAFIEAALNASAHSS